MKIACCGLDCEKCKAREATVNDDNKLREEVAKQWTKLNNVLIKPEDINCLGCNESGVKSPFCEHLCPIRLCAKEKNLLTCIECDLFNTCDKIRMIISNNKDALNNLEKIKKEIR